MIDYLIVGAGLAGISFAETVLNEGKTTVVIDNDSHNASRVAGGLYNPVVLKRFTEVWNATNQLKEMNDFYESLQKKINIAFDNKMPILRKFFSVEEQNNWFLAADKSTLSPFLSTTLHFTQYHGITAPFGYGEVLQTGYVNTALLLDNYRHYLSKMDCFINEAFDYSSICFLEEGIVYKNIQAKHLIFAEGFGLHHNPYFNFLPLDGTKGELFIIKAPALQLDVIINTSVFILPLGNDFFKVGATYNWNDKTALPTAEGKAELIGKIKEILDCEFEVVAHFAGVRPTVRDRRPLVGTHHVYPQLHLLNGLGTRGVMIGPSVAKALYHSITHKTPLPKEINWTRFLNKIKK